MNAVIFDTHAFVKRLTAVGMPEAQAEVLADEQARLIDERLATKSDLQALEVRLGANLRETEQRLAAGIRETDQRLAVSIRETDQRLRELELHLQAEIAEGRADILKWMFGTIGFQTLVLLGAILALAKALH